MIIYYLDNLYLDYFDFKFKFVAILNILTFFYTAYDTAYTLGIRLNIKHNDRKKIKLTD